MFGLYPKRIWPRASEMGVRTTLTEKDVPMEFNVVMAQPLISLIAGVLILLMPRLLNYVVAFYLILFGVIGLWPNLVSGSG